MNKKIIRKIVITVIIVNIILSFLSLSQQDNIISNISRDVNEGRLKSAKTKILVYKYTVLIRTSYVLRILEPCILLFDKNYSDLNDYVSKYRDVNPYYLANCTVNNDKLFNETLTFIKITPELNNKSVYKKYTGAILTHCDWKRRKKYCCSILRKTLKYTDETNHYYCKYYPSDRLYLNKRDLINITNRDRATFCNKCGEIIANNEQCRQK